MVFLESKATSDRLTLSYKLCSQPPEWQDKCKNLDASVTCWPSSWEGGWGQPSWNAILNQAWLRDAGTKRYKKGKERKLGYRHGRDVRMLLVAFQGVFTYKEGNMVVCIKARTPGSQCARSESPLCQFIAMWHWAGRFTACSESPYPRACLPHSSVGTVKEGYGIAPGIWEVPQSAALTAMVSPHLIPTYLTHFTAGETERSSEVK